MLSSTLNEIRPAAAQRVIDLVAAAGVDVSDWKHYKGKDPSKNPKYCYEWSFVEPGNVVVLNLWFDRMELVGDDIVQRLSLRGLRSEAAGTPKALAWRRRRRKLEQDIRSALSEGLPIRVIVCDGDQRDADAPDPQSSKVRRRRLDVEHWAVTYANVDSGEYTLTRGAEPISAQELTMAKAEGFEGQLAYRFSVHRRRERKLRKAKIETALLDNNGRLRCQVPGCDFDYADVYGELGLGYAQVHHLSPLGDAPAFGRSIALEDLAIVCANCHSMIHRNGECRPLEGLVLNKSA